MSRLGIQNIINICKLYITFYRNPKYYTIKIIAYDYTIHIKLCRMSEARITNFSDRGLLSLRKLRSLS